MRIVEMIVNGSPVNVELGKVYFGPVEEKRKLLTVKVHDPITVSSQGIVELTQVLNLILSKTLGYFGMDWRIRHEMDFITGTNPKLRPLIKNDLQKCVVLFRPLQSSRIPGPGPTGNLVFVAVDFQRESLLGHVQRLLRLGGIQKEKP